MEPSEKKTFPRKLIYFEKQSSDRLCGVHCLNALLQGPFFDPVMLSEIGLKLDELENQLYDQKIKRNENVDDDGNYNVQVLTEALKVYGAEIQTLKQREAISILEKDYGKMEALIFNSSTHWFAIRNIDDIWFNLNSTNALPGPEVISDFYLSAFIQGSEDIGYTNFLVHKLPKLPDPKSQVYQNLQSYQKLVSFEDIITAREAKKAQDKMKEGSHEEEEKKEEENKFKAFTGKGVVLDDSIKYTISKPSDFDDPEMKQAYELSLTDYITNLQANLPEEPSQDDPSGYNINIKINDQLLSRRWRGEDRIYDLINYVKVTIKTFSNIELFEAFPRKVYNNEEAKIEEAGLSKNQMLMGRVI